MDWTAIIVAIVAAGGSLFGTVITIRQQMKEQSGLINYRMDQVEERVGTLSDKVEKHNSIVERTFRLEDKFELVDEKIKVANHRIDDLERERSLK